jgi:hypothetical protein
MKALGIGAALLALVAGILAVPFGYADSDVLNLFTIAWAIAIVGFGVATALAVFGRDRFDLGLRILLLTLATPVLLAMVVATTNFHGAADAIWAEGDYEPSAWQGLVGVTLLLGFPFLVVVLIAVGLSEMFQGRSR